MSARITAVDHDAPSIINDSYVEYRPEEKI
jgi:hypothetical protein